VVSMIAQLFNPSRLITKGSFKSDDPQVQVGRLEKGRRKR